MCYNDFKPTLSITAGTQQHDVRGSPSLNLLSLSLLIYCDQSTDSVRLCILFSDLLCVHFLLLWCMVVQVSVQFQSTVFHALYQPCQTASVGGVL